MLWRDNFCPSLSRNVCGEFCVLPARKAGMQASARMSTHTSVRYLFVYVLFISFVKNLFLLVVSLAFRFRFRVVDDRLRYWFVISLSHHWKKENYAKKVRRWRVSPGTPDMQNRVSYIFDNALLPQTWLYYTLLTEWSDGRWKLLTHPIANIDEYADTSTRSWWQSCQDIPTQLE